MQQTYLELDRQGLGSAAVRCMVYLSIITPVIPLLESLLGLPFSNAHACDVAFFLAVLPADIGDIGLFDC